MTKKKTFNKPAASKQGKLKKEKEFRASQPLSLSLIFPLETNKKNLSILIELLENIREDYYKNVEIILVENDSVEITEKLLKENTSLAGLKEVGVLKTINTGSPVTKAVQIKEGIENSVKDYCAVIDFESFLTGFNIIEIITLKRDVLKKNSVIKCIFQDKAKKAPGIFIYDTLFAKYLFDNLSVTGSNYYNEILYKCRKLEVPVETIILKQSSPFDQEKKMKCSIKNCITSCFNWFFILPVKELTTKPHLQYKQLKESSIFRFFFVAIAICLLFIIPILSYDSGISGDEHTIVGQAEKVYKYFETSGADTSATFSNKMDPMQLYGISFDVFTLVVNKMFNIEKTFELRHFFNGLTGWIAILFAGLFMSLIAGWRAGVLTMLFLFFSPRFLGHSFNNPKDIPFAMGYIFTIYFITKFVKELPKPGIWTSIMIALGIAVTNSLRIGGLILIPYLVMFAGLWFLSNGPKKAFLGNKHLSILKKLIYYVVPISVVGYFLGLVLWPYGLLDPLHNPIDALGQMTKFSISLRQLFEGSIIWSDQIPWYYVPKYMSITIPIFILLGFVLFFVFFNKIRKTVNWLWLYIILFAFIFPIFWVIYQGSNLYGGWRHFNFTYIFLIIASVLGYEALYKTIQHKYVKYLPYALMLVLAIHPIKHIIKNHPYEYIYYNELQGGVEGAYGHFEMDYYYHSVKEATQALIDKVDFSKYDSTNLLLVSSNFSASVRYYLRDYEDRVKVKYMRYYERGNHDWDYAIIINSYIDPYQLLHNKWPPENSIYTVTVNEKPICTVLERRDKSDYYGHQAIKNNELQKAIELFNKALSITKDNEVAYLNLADAYMKLKDYDNALATINKVLEFYPDYDNALNYQGWAYLNKNQPKRALESFNKIIKTNFKFTYAYFGAANAYLRLNNAYAAINVLNQGIQINQGFKPFYQMLGNIYKQQGQEQLAKQYLDFAARLP